jgi:hypothetical protein
VFVAGPKENASGKHEGEFHGAYPYWALLEFPRRYARAFLLPLTRGKPERICASSPT